MPDFVDEKLKEIQARLAEIKPLVAEYDRLVAAESALVGIEEGKRPGAASAKAAPKRRGRRASGGAAAAGTGAKRRGRPKGSGTRSIQALELVRARPGITIPELAETMGIKQNYLYRVMPELSKSGQLRKSGRGWYPKD